MFIDRPVLDLVHLVKLSLEEDEILAGLRLGVHNTLLVLLKSVDDFHEVALVEEEFEVLGSRLFYNLIVILEMDWSSYIRWFQWA